MALRRVLPSRQTGASSPDTSVASASPPASSQPAAAPAPAAVSVPVAAPAAPEPVKASQAEIAAIASSAFSTLPTVPVGAPAIAPTHAGTPEAPAASKPARVLEDSFAASSPAPTPIVAPLPQPIIPSVADFQPTAAPTPMPAPEAPAAPAEAARSAASGGAGNPEPKPESKPEPKVETTPAPAPVAAPAPSTPASTPSRPDNNRFKRQVGGNGGSGQGSRKPPRGDGQRAEPRPEATPAAPRAEAPRQSAPQAAPAANISSIVDEFLADTSAKPAPSTMPAPVVPAEKPQPQTSQPKTSEPRRNRAKRERDFAAATVAAPESQQTNRPTAGTAALAQRVPVNTRSLDKVDEELIASGIIAPPPGDSLTSSVPVSLAVAEEEHFDPAEPAPLPPLPQQEESRLDPQPFTAKPAAPVAPAATSLPTPTSDLPWVSNTGGNSGWEVELPATPAEATPITAAPPPPGDFFKPLANSPASSGPAWASGARQGGVPAPELPGARGIKGPSMGRGGTPVWGIGVAGLAVAIVAFFLWNSSGSQQNQLQEKVARWTGSLKENTENLPGDMGGSATANAGSNMVKPEGTFSMSDFHTNPNGSAGALLPPPAIAAASPVSSSAQIAFADVAPDQSGQPIVADGSEKMPEDVSLFAKFQQAVAEARAQKQADASGVSGTAPKQMASADSGPLTPEKLKEELSAYRKSLVDAAAPVPATPAAAAKPAGMGKDPAAYMDGQDQLAGAPPGTLQPPPANGAEGGQAGSGMLPPPDLYTNNPNHLPIVGEPSANAPARVRTLADFEVEPFAPEAPKVRIPRIVKPKMATTDFPTLQVLSFVQGRGIIASIGGREGVLLIGETMEGWELTNVTPEMAEFRAGQKRHYVTVND